MAETVELTAALQKLAFNMLLADEVAVVPRSAAAYWLVHVRTRKTGRLPRAGPQDMRTAERLLRMEGALRHLRLARGNVEWFDLENRPAFAVEVLRQLPMGNRLLRLTARDSLATTWKLLGDTATVEWLLDVLATERGYRVRARAARALGFIGERRAVPVLVKLLEFERSSVRLEALIALGRIADPSTLPVVADLLERRPYDAVAFHAGRALALFGPLAVPTLAERAREAGDRACIAALGLIGDPSAVPALEELLRRGYPIAAQAVMALARLGEPGLVALLNAASSREIQTQALHAISERNDPRVLAAVEADLRQEQGVSPIVVGHRIPVDATNLGFFLRCARDPTSKVREYAAHALGRTPRRYMRRAFNSLMRLALDPDRHVQWAAQRSLAEMRPTAQLLRRMGSRDRAIRGATLSVLGFIRDPALLDVFRDRLADDGEDIEVRKAAGEALVRSVPRATLERAVALLGDESSVVRVWIAHGFHHFVSARPRAERDAAVAALRGAAEDPDPGVREQVMRSLGRVDGWWAPPDQKEQTHAVLWAHLRDSSPPVREAARETLSELERDRRNHDEWLNQRRQPYWTGRDAWTGAIGHMLAACGWDEEPVSASDRFVYRALNRAGRRCVTVERLPYTAGGVALDGEIARDGEYECIVLRWMETTSPFAARHAISEWTDPFVSPDDMRQNLERLRSS